MTDFVVDRLDVSKLKDIKAPPIILEDGQVLVRVVKFALTANTISYATAGNSLNYFDFFPCDQTQNKNYARIPTWGIGVVVASRCDKVKSGQKLYGYFPMSSFLVVEPTKVSAYSFSDGAKHRQHLAPVYNNYNICEADAYYEEAAEDFMIIQRPLWSTSWVLDDWHRKNEFFGATAIIISSASSKTSYGLAFELKANKANIQIFGLTSPRNVNFVKELNLYDHIVTYDDIEKIDNTIKTCFVDMAGNRRVLERLHMHLGDNMVNSCLVGNTHWERNEMKMKDLPGAVPQFFFAPAQFQSRTKEWGPEGLTKRMVGAWKRYTNQAIPQGYLKVKYFNTVPEILNVYSRLSKGDVHTQEGIVCSLWPQDDTKANL